jgi:cell division protein FtsA
VKQSGVLAVGGDHITNDISMGLRIPMTRAENLKIEKAASRSGIVCPARRFCCATTRFRRQEIERETLNTDHPSAAA